MQVADIISAIEQFAPISLQEDWDNSGLQLGARNVVCSGVLLCVDVTPDVVDEAIVRECNLIVSHHPLLFKGLKRITGNTPVEQCVMKAIANGINVYSCHTAIDNAENGVSWQMAKMLGLKDIETLERQQGKMLKLSTMIPNVHVDKVRLALFDAGAGQLGNYDSCSFSVKGEGTFRALKGANPYVGNLNEFHLEAETRIDVILPVWLKHKVETALIQAHPYEEPAYEFVRLDNASPHSGLGVVGNYSEGIAPMDLIAKVKSAFGSPMVRCNRCPKDLSVRRVAMGSGACASLIPNAIASGAQAYITSDARYHDFVDFSDRILLIDIGHYESEHCTKDIFYHVITEKFPNFAVYYSDKEKNPINYL